MFFSEVFFMGETLFDNNTAGTGGAIMVECASILLQANISFNDNSANSQGGAIHASMSNIVVLPNSFIVHGISATDSSNSVLGTAHFIHNQADEGGAINAMRSNNYQCPSDKLP